MLHHLPCDCCAPLATWTLKPITEAEAHHSSHHSWNPPPLVNPSSPHCPLSAHQPGSQLITWTTATSPHNLGGQRSSGSFGQVGWPVGLWKAAHHHHYVPLRPFLSNTKGSEWGRAAVETGHRRWPQICQPLQQWQIFNIFYYKTFNVSETFRAWSKIHLFTLKHVWQAVQSKLILALFF